MDFAGSLSLLVGYALLALGFITVAYCFVKFFAERRFLDAIVLTVWAVGFPVFVPQALSAMLSYIGILPSAAQLFTGLYMAMWLLSFLWIGGTVWGDHGVCNIHPWFFFKSRIGSRYTWMALALFVGAVGLERLIGVPTEQVTILVGVGRLAVMGMLLYSAMCLVAAWSSPGGTRPGPEDQVGHSRP